jgi:hypothetical protein
VGRILEALSEVERISIMLQRLVPLASVALRLLSPHSLTLLLLVLLLGACTVAPTGPVAGTWTDVDADEGATLEHPTGARLVIPPHALSADARVRIVDEGMATPRAGRALMAASPRFGLDIDGAEVMSELAFSVDLPPDEAHLVMATRTEDGGVKLHRGEPGLAGVTVYIDRNDLYDTRGGFLHTAVSAQFIPDLDLAAEPKILPTPYYWQDNLPWCVPTSLAMVMNQYDDLEGIVSNYALAGADHQADDEGNSYVGILNSWGVDDDLYTYLKWDADLIPSAPFSSYVRLQTNGYNLQDLLGPTIDFGFGSVPVPDLFVPPRAPGLSSTTTSHAFVAVGANDSHIWLHDPSGAFSGSASIAEKLTWEAFRQIAIDDTSATELRSLTFFATPKDVDERLGSIVLEEGSGSSLRYRADNGTTLSTWQWDGSSWSSGYVWDDLTNTLPQDGNYGNRFPLTGGELDGYFSYKARVANVSAQERQYQLWVFLGNTFNPSLDVRIHDLTLDPYSWSGNTVTGNLDAFEISDEGVYRITFELYQGGELQDVKRVDFRVGDGPPPVF